MKLNMLQEWFSASIRMATRYEGTNGEPDLEVIDYLPADNKVLLTQFMQN